MPKASRWPIPWPVAAAAAVWLAKKGWMGWALALVTAYVTYARPGELFSLQVRHLIPPIEPRGVVPGAGGGRALPLSRYSLVIRDSGLRVPTKTGAFDNSVILDRPDLLWMDKWWYELRRARPLDAPLFPGTQAAFSKAVKEAGEAVGANALSMVAYSLRHGGASWDFLMKYRDLKEVKTRGHWLADRSMTRYSKSSKLLAAMHELTTEARGHAELCAGRLELFLDDPASAPAPPGRG